MSEFLEDQSLLELVKGRWAHVKRENLTDQALVTEAEWGAWLSFEREVSQGLEAITSTPLSPQERSFLELLLSQISQAKRLSTEELWHRRNNVTGAARA